jgi:CubicO group peptidase (beta-lactamase class C family)
VADWKSLPLASTTSNIITSAVQNKARSYAAANRSSALIIYKDGKIVSEDYFGDNDKDSLIVSKSLAKPLGVVAIGRAIQEGFIQSLEQPAADFITEWKDTPKEAIRVRDLIGMQSGLLPQAGAYEPENILNRAYLHPFHDQVIIDDYPLVTEPGKTYAYSNANAELVAPLIERATGIQYEDWLRDEVFIPLGAKGGEVWMNRDGGTPHAGCCILLPADTYLRMGILFAENGIWQGEQLLPVSFIENVKAPGADYPQAGMGLYLGHPYRERRGAAGKSSEYTEETYHSAPYLSDDLFLFDGNSNQVVYMIPSQDLVILRTGAWAPKEPAEWDNAFLPNLIISNLQE